VTRGQPIAYSDNSGACTTGSHLHFGVFNSQSGWVSVDPYGWTFGDVNAADPWGSDVGHLWATRIGSFNSTGIAIKEGRLGASWGDISLPTGSSGSVTALSIDGLRIGIVRGGTAYVRDTSINTGERPANNDWQLFAYNALDIKLAGGWIAVMKTDRWVDMKVGALNSGWYATVAQNAWQIALTPNRLAVL
jgi:hypothetical protein